MRIGTARIASMTTSALHAKYRGALLAMLIAGGILACSSNGDNRSTPTGDGGTGGGAGSGTGGNTTGTGGGSPTGDGSVASSDLGKACAADTECTGGLKCIKATDSVMFQGGPAHGYCTMDCTMNTQCAPLGGFCVNFAPTENDPPQGLCLLGCTYGAAAGATKCLGRSEVACVGDVGMPSVCVPLCSQDSDCPTGRKCDPTGGVCIDLAPTGDPLGSHCSGDADAGPTCAGGCIGYSTATFCTQRCVLGVLSGCNHATGALGTERHGICDLGDQGANAGDMGYCVQECDTAADCSDQADPGVFCNMAEQSVTGHGYCDWGAGTPEGGLPPGDGG
jgi:Cys-rich repeat protein